MAKTFSVKSLVRVIAREVLCRRRSPCSTVSSYLHHGSVHEALFHSLGYGSGSLELGRLSSGHTTEGDDYASLDLSGNCCAGSGGENDALRPTVQRATLVQASTAAEFMVAKAMPCSEDSISEHFSLFHILSVPFSYSPWALRGLFHLFYREGGDKLRFFSLSLFWPSHK